MAGISLTAPPATRATIRGAVALATALAAAAHIPVIAPHLDEAPYMGVLFIALTVACAGLSVAVLIRPAAAVYQAVIVVCGSAIIGYAATRLIAFPMLADDVGNWWDPLGVVAVLAEAFAIGCAARAMAART